MANCAIVGINWGDEGKGRMVDYLTGQYDVVVRYQGGGNAGHHPVSSGAAQMDGPICLLMRRSVLQPACRDSRRRFHRHTPWR